MTNTAQNPFIVIGGGIGGLATALGVAENNQYVKVLEQAPEFGEVGAGIQLAANATNVLQRLGVMDKINEIAVFPKRLVLMDAFSGKELSALDLGEVYRERYGAPYIVLHRSDLHRVLLEACQENPYIELATNQKITTTEENDQGVTVKAENGDVHKGIAVIGADGLWSNVRKMFSDDQPICSGYVAYRGAIPIEEVKTSIGDMDDVYMWIGPDLHLVQYPVRRGELYNQVVVFKSKNYRPEIEKTEDWGTPEEMDAVFAGSCELVQNAISFISRQKRWPMFDRLPIENWTQGHITLTGDAAHPMLQYLAQGACQALEDAAYMSDMLSAHGEDIPAAFTAFQKERQPRTAYVQGSARTWGEIIHNTTNEGILLRNIILGKRQSNDFEFVDQFHGYNKNAKLVEA
ncbi:FAD-dependent monooxygenase [Cytobacillus sp. FSL W7-1323]|uniref:3-hydroxybenzoate 6-hydroxylase n=1 Tax=Cytobacillus kochii TaxID=859143 RepID=A0A248TGK5_9BACI|nr:MULTISPECIES: FAD-dependent monooxygenase [Cytobacillus]ASV67344.1 3-hydroxybenzoate 6-hydroxylase [Cytobacillus kochii]MEA1854917.1 FAD-dependent monooxygenase [Cytobacillus sp. OWB-43]